LSNAHILPEEKLAELLQRDLLKMIAFITCSMVPNLAKFGSLSPSFVRGIFRKFCIPTRPLRLKPCHVDKFQNIG